MGGIDLGWVDVVLAAFLVVSVLIGVMRGFVFELLSLAGWFVAFIAARLLAPLVQPYIPLGEPGTALNHGVAFAAVFLAALVVWGLSARLVRALLHATPLGLPDRFLGALFGALRGMVILLLLAALVALTPLKASFAWQQSQGGAWLAAAVQGIRAWWPGAVAPRVSALTVPAGPAPEAPT